MSWIDVKGKKEEVAKLVTRAGEILKLAHDEKRELDAEQNTNFEQLHADADKIKAEIRQLEIQQQAEKDVEQRIGREDVEITEPKAKGDLAERAFDKMLRYGSASLSVEERSAYEKRAMSSDTATEGAEFVPESFHTSFVEVLKYYGGVREAGATVIKTQHGRQYPVPILDDTANIGEMIGQNVAADDSDADPDTDALVLGAYNFTSKVVKQSLALVRDAGFDVQGWLAPQLANRIGRIQNTKFTTGVGSTEPQGCVTGSSLGKAAASTTAITYNEILDLIHSLDKSYRDGAVFMMNDSTLLALRKIVDGDGNPLWNHGNVAAAHPDTLAGYPYVVNNDMDTIAADKKVILFGNFSEGYYIRDVQAMELIVFNEKYKNALQMGYMGYVAGDAGVVNSGALKHFIMDDGV